MDPLVPASPVGAAALAVAADPRADVHELFDAHFEFVWRTVRRFGVPAPQVDDAVQEVFLVAMRRRAAIEPGREQAFLFGTAMRIAAGLRRTHARRRDQVAADDALVAEAPSPAPGQDALLDQKRARALLEACIEVLPDDLRAVFILYELEGMTAAAIAELLALPPGTVASRLRRARESFRAAVARAAGPEVRGG